MFILPLCFIASLGQAWAKPASNQPVALRNASEPQPSKEALERMRNRAKLLAKVKKTSNVVPLTPAQKLRETRKKQAQRAINRKQLARHTPLKPKHFGSSDRRWSVPDEMLRAKVSNPRLEIILHNVIRRLKLQLGKPYVWGGQAPETGFDCSGLVNYAFNNLLNGPLPRTAQGMFQDGRLKQVAQSELRQGDLVFFRLNTQQPVDHVGIYMGNGQFIEAPRTGLNVRVSQLTDDFWQNRYLGAKRVLTDEAIL